MKDLKEFDRFYVYESLTFDSKITALIMNLCYYLHTIGSLCFKYEQSPLKSGVSFEFIPKIIHCAKYDLNQNWKTSSRFKQ